MNAAPLANVETGPNEYPAHRNASILFGVLFILILLSKSALVYIECRTNWDTFKLIMTCLFFVAIVNIYLLFMIEYRNYMTRAKFRNVFLTPFVYWLLLNHLVYLGIPILGYVYFQREMLLEMILGCCICLLDSAAFVLVLAYSIREYKPLTDSFKYVLTDTTQYSHEVVKELHIVESSSFKIIITNASEVPVDGPVTIKRTVVWKTKRRNLCNMGKNNETVSFSMNLEGQLQPKEELIFIPETHAMEGAIKVKDFRSFGNNRGRRVQTEVIFGKRGKISHVKELNLVNRANRDIERQREDKVTAHGTPSSKVAP